MDLEDSCSSSNDRSPPSASSSPSSSQVPPSPCSFKRKAGRKKFKETRHPFYRGVRQRNGEKWVCEVREPHKKTRIWLGTFPTPDMAARAYDVAAIALRGRSAQLNFPDSPAVLPRASSAAAADIQVAAAAAAEAFRPGAEEKWGLEKVEEKGKGEEEGSGFMDEEELFNMPGLLVDMAEGMLIPPPPAVEKEPDIDEINGHGDFSLWSDL
ncbi:Dehydration-responsive element-binding protein [Asimina triloba]